MWGGNPADGVLSHATSLFQKPQALGGRDGDSATQSATLPGTFCASELPKCPPVLEPRLEPRLEPHRGFA